MLFVVLQVNSVVGSIDLALLDFAILAISSIVAVMEPFSTIAVYATLTKNMTPEKKRETIARSMKISFVVLVFLL
jgi:small neutral amino acid transporter SnatA (MarC family)